MAADDLIESLKELSRGDLLMVQAATISRVRHMQKSGVAVDKQMAAQIIVEYAKEARAGRPLTEGFHPREEVVFSRNYNCLYQPPSKKEESI